MSKLSLTTPVQTVVSVLAGAVLTFVGLQILEAAGGVAPEVPWTVPAVLVVLAILGFVHALTIPGRRERRTLGQQEAFLAVVAGKAMIITGAALAGAHAIVVMRNLSMLEAASPMRRVVHGGLTLVASLLVAGAGSSMEHRLVVQDPPDESGGRHADGAGA